MTHTVCQPCYDCKYTDCVAVCPVECFYQDEKMLYIDPADCIDCEACVPECPVEAIFAEANVPAQWTSFTPINADKAPPPSRPPATATSPRRGTPRKGRSARRSSISSASRVGQLVECVSGRRIRRCATTDSPTTEHYV